MDICLTQMPQLTILVGYYGVGKTNLALNLALGVARHGEPVTLVDLDIVNPYFRSSDYPELLEGGGVTLLAPTFARSTLENPSLPAAINGAFDSEGTVIIDVGGDDAGATTLSRYRPDIQRYLERGGAGRGDGAQDPQDSKFAFFYVVNRFRSNAPSPEEAASEAIAQLRDIEIASGLKATGIINNTHLQSETSLDTILEGLAFGEAAAKLDALPLIATTIPKQLAGAALTEHPTLRALYDAGQLWPLELLVTTPWQARS